MGSTPRFYVYVLARPDGRPFYVGKGSGYRIGQHERDARRGHRCRRCNVIRKIWRDGGEVGRFVIYTTDSESEAFAREQALIAFFGRSKLTNATDGGEGSSGASFVRSPEHSRLISELRKAQLSDPVRLAKHAEGTRKQWTPERRAKQSERMRLQFADPEERARLKDGLRRGWVGRKAQGRTGWTEERRQAQIARMKAYASTPEGKAQIDAARTKRWQAVRVQG